MAKVPTPPPSRDPLESHRPSVGSARGPGAGQSLLCDQQEASMGPLPPSRAVSFLQMRRMFPRAERSDKKPRVPTSKGGSPKPQLPPALPPSLSQTLVPWHRWQSCGKGQHP